MSHRLALAAFTLAAATLAAPVHAASLTPGNLFVYRVGTGAAALTSAANAVFVDEFTTAGVLVQSIAMPTVAVGPNGILTASGTAVSDGYLSVSTDQQFLMLTGYNATLGTAGPAGSAGTMARTVGRVALDGSINTTTLLTDASISSNFRSVASTNGTDLWLSGNAATAANGGVRYATLGGTTSTQLASTPTNTRVVAVFDGQLYVSASSGTTRMATVGAGLPTAAGQLISNLPGLPTTGSPYGFFFADLSAAVPGLDTLYIADEGAGILKYSLSGGNWTANGIAGAAADTFRGLTGTVSDGVVQLFATGLGGSGATGGGKLVALTDSAGYGGAFAPTFTTLATAANNTSYRGVAYLATPIPEPRTYALMLAGVAALGLVAHRRRVV